MKQTDSMGQSPGSSLSKESSGPAGSSDPLKPPGRLQQFLNSLYLVKCFRRHRLLFFVSILFIVIVLYGHKSSCDITPAIVFGMYTSAGHIEKDSFLLITVNDKEQVNLYHTIDEPRRMMIFSTLSAYHQGVIAGYEDPQEEAISLIVNKHPFIRPLSRYSYNTRSGYAEYLPWLLKYMQGAVDKNIKKIKISLEYLHYNEKNLPVADSTHSLYEFEQTNAK